MAELVVVQVHDQQADDDEQQQDGHDSAHLPEGVANHLGQGQGGDVSDGLEPAGGHGNHQGQLLFEPGEQGDGLRQRGGCVFSKG